MDRTSTAAVLRVPRRLGLLVPLVALLIGGCSAATVARSAAAPPATPANSAETSTVGAPVSGADVAVAGTPGVSMVGSTGSGSATTNAAIAYPYPALGGSAGLAPDHELVVNGTGEATVKTDLSNRAAAQRSALAAAIADAKAQAESAAADAGVRLGGVVSLSVSVGGGSIGILPMGASAPGTGAIAPDGTTSVPPAAGGSAPILPATEQLEVTVTVAYSIS